ncbi:hypothetical protein FEDK69T_02760 [Flavobacterium enshiense DK69]|uniref:Natural product n=1 Tax=Flavobacterium enshiense DK69 TaxID=1107311 RepID=V6SE38_9FLAO|nr:hypothetical protein [Flavobacterium enshiense]ESU24724.1 hypothetical protein FEDK69T_02760 [Flavobacterium enshiense DK69]KGO96818.1 hypothetical protein Q767_03690 [Flavobacterium enshiense DK69]
MKTRLLNIKGVEVLSRESQKMIQGSGKGNPDLSLCGCSCSGSVTGPDYCVQYIACPQVYTCKDEI